MARGSGIETEVPVAIVASFREGLITQLKDYGDKDEALEAVGLRE
jgi:ketosteroid isomerase-like protein